MDFSEQLQRVAQIYSKQGFNVRLQPGPENLPDFAKDFKVELLSTRMVGGGGVLVKVFHNREQMEADLEVAHYAEVIGKQPGWRFDFVILEQESPLARAVRGEKEPSDNLITSFLSHAEALAENGHTESGLLMAWAGLEAAMRRRLRAEGEEVGWGTPPRQLLSQLNSSGIISSEEFVRLETTLRQRSVIGHGFDGSPIDLDSVPFLIKMAHRFLAESNAAKQTV